MSNLASAPKIVKWNEPPAMDAGAPMPAIYSDGSGLTCGYVIGATDPRVGTTAVLHFDGVLYYAFGYPNDEALHGHPLYTHGLSPYEFQLVENSSLIAKLDEQNQIHSRHVAGSFLKRFQHWVITFHDDTLEVVATEAHVQRISASQPDAAVRDRT